jgi:serine/threonine protein kinase
MKGGAMIDSGGFGCVFRPPLRCANKTRKRDGISKLQMKKNALNEYNTIISIQKVLKKIPHYQDYFIIDTIICAPHKLSVSDKINMPCTALEHKNITQKNINRNLKKLLVLQMEYGGISLKKVARSVENYGELMEFHNKITTFFQDGILPMNAAGIIHSDIKLPNLLYNKHIKLIDWGYTYNLNEKHEIIPKRFHYNICFAVILFQHEDAICEYFQKVELNEENAEILCSHILHPHENRGHYESLDEMLGYLNIHDLRETVLAYLVKIIMKYTDKNTKKFDLKSYFYEVYVKNCDVWSFLIMFLETIDFLKADVANEKKVKIYISNVIEIVVEKYLFNLKYATRPFDTDTLIRDLRGVE